MLVKMEEKRLGLLVYKAFISLSSAGERERESHLSLFSPLQPEAEAIKKRGERLEEIKKKG